MKICVIFYIGVYGTILHKATGLFENNNKRIIGGKETLFHEFPWQIGLERNDGKSKGEHICGGSLIDKNFILTAAHCFVHGVNPKDYYIKLGDHFKDIKDHSHEQIKAIYTIIIHEDYNPITYDNDIAIIKLVSPATINDYVYPVSLPHFLDFEIPGFKCTITGWGDQGKNITTKYSNALHKTNIKIVSFSTCDHSRSYQGRLSRNMFCAGHIEGLKDACQGDSGGPLQCMTRGQWVLYGITSWGDGCGIKHKYGVYTVVRNYLIWINEIINEIDVP